MIELIEKYNTVIFTLLGVTLGALITFIGNLVLKRNELKLKLREKVLDKRMQAHENIINLTKTLRTMNILGFDSKTKEVLRIPNILTSRQQFDEWYTQYYNLTAYSTTWLSTDLTRELNLFLDYIINLYEKIQNIDDKKIILIGYIIRQDFIDFSGELEKLAFILFERDLYKLKLNDLKKWHKYEKTETEKRLQNTELLKKEIEIDKIINNY
jgi:hypothetical protein